MGWLSSEAGMLFLGSKDADGDVVDILQERIGNLTKVLQVNGYKSVLQSADDDGAELNDHQKWHIEQKAIYLREDYKLALEKWATNCQSESRSYIEVAPKVTRKKIPGWYGKGKGLMQVLWERGFIDASKPYSHYQVEKKVDGKVVEDISLRHMMGKCTDFAEEVSQLEAIGKKLGCSVIITTKYHAEYAGEGIEYSWGLA
ncbi:hypothetical protein THAOC_27108, partial [Thalassiosira oceanica]